jgi:hypothetical protein
VFYIGLATDFDGTLATNGRVPDEVLDSLRVFRKTERKLLLVTGRQLGDLKACMPELALFDRVVAENGGVLYEPAAERRRDLAPAPPKEFVDALRERGVSPLSVGDVIVATWEPNQQIVLDVIKELGLELQIIFNKGAVMVLPPGVNKASGLAAALAEMNISPHNIVGIGDAENDHAFLEACGLAVAVANALPMLKDGADVVTKAARGEGVLEIMEAIASRDAELLPPRAGIALGHSADGKTIRLLPGKGSVVLAGQSGIGKSTIATALTEQMAEKHYQFCVLDPEGDFTGLDHAVTVGDANNAAPQEKITALLELPSNNVVASALGMTLADRPRYLAELLPKITSLRARAGHPHWLIIDEAHHVLPAGDGTVAERFPRDIAGALFITVHPREISQAALKSVRHVIACGMKAADVIAEFCEATEREAPVDSPACGETCVLYWDCDRGAAPLSLKPAMPAQEHRRHTRKYAQGELGEDNSFWFRGPEGKLNLRAQNLVIFVQIAEGVDDETWEFHRRAHHYSRWFRDIIKDNDLAQSAEAIENSGSSAAESRRLICDEIRARYTAPAR